MKNKSYFENYFLKTSLTLENPIIHSYLLHFQGVKVRFEILISQYVSFFLNIESNKL
jgi:hypothetical protein